MVHRAVGRPATVMAVSLDDTLEATPLGAAHHVNLVLGREDVGQHRVAGLGLITLIDRNLGQVPRRRHPGLVEVADHRLGHRVLSGDPGRLALGLDQTQLHRLVTIRFAGLALHNNARTGLDDRHRDHPTLIVEKLAHADLLSENSPYHVVLTSRRRP